MTGSGSNGFQALERAVQAAAACINLVSRTKNMPGDMSSQITRAASSVPLNLAEGSGRAGKDRIHHFRIAYSSAREATTGIELLVACGSIGRKDAAEALELLDRTKAMTWRLIRPRGQ